MEPLVSVAMITYNHAPYISQAIEGVVNQKASFPFELVIGEDFSTDGTREIVFEYEKKYPGIIRVITSEENVGAKKNGRRVKEAAQGKYIAFCEGDDYWHNPLKLQIQVDYLESNPECGMVTADCNVYFDSAGALQKDFSQNQGFRDVQKITLEHILKRRLLWTCTAVIEKKLVDQIITGDPYLHLNEKFLMGDSQLWAEASVLSEVVYLPQTLATYRKLDESLSSSNDVLKTIRFSKSSSEMRLYLCGKYNVSDNLRKDEEWYWCDVSLRLAFYTRDAKLADEVKAKKEHFNLRERLRYLGSKNPVVHCCYRAGKYLYDLFGKKENFWQQ